MDFKKIDGKYRAIPFWSWNEKLSEEETARQVSVMHKAGLGGYFMHARGGLLTEYMGDEWFANVKAACDAGEALGMDSWAYDENGWPSGFADGKILEMGEEYLEKYLVYTKTENFSDDPARIVCEKNGITYFYKVNELYTDLLNPAVTEAFIREVYEVYREKFGNRIAGFFTDEPQLIRFPGYPWSVVTLTEFRKRYSYDLLDEIESLFFEVGDYERVRIDFWKMTTDLFSENYFKKLYEWCDKYGYKLTGHLVCEDYLEGLVPMNGSAMAHYEYFHIPGVDWLGRPTGHSLIGCQIGSAAAQTGKQLVMTESFAMTGHNVSHAELKKIFEWQAVRGVNLLCTHLEGYSNRGIRKRDYPAAIYYQQPWWEDAKIFFDCIARIGMILGEGKPVADTLVIHPLTKVWSMYNGNVESREAFEKIKAYDRAFAKELACLEDKHILFHLGDETLIERHGSVDGGYFVIGNMKYKRVIIPEGIRLLDKTKSLIDKFARMGGELTSVDSIESNPITAPSALSYTMREYPDFKVHYFVNSTDCEISASISKCSLAVNAESGEVYPFTGEHTFAPTESLILLENGEEASKPSTRAEEKPLSLVGEWEVKEASYNSLTLDRCDYYFDGELIEKSGYVLNILPRLNELRRPVKLHQRYSFFVHELPEGEIFLATETPEIFDIKVNGVPLEKRDVGDFRDISFRRLPITSLVKLGENIIELDSEICQSEKTFNHLDKSWSCETMSNCLSYDIEIEQIYIVGDFGVMITADREELAEKAYRVKEMATSGGYSFAITKAPATVDISKLDESGFPEFAGAITLRRKISVSDNKYFANLVGNGMNSIHLSVNGKEVGARMFPPYKVSLSDCLRVGENELEIKIINNLRNMQGPFHWKAGEDLFCARGHFYRESNVFCHPAGADEHCHDVMDSIFSDDVCLVHFGISEN